MGCGKKEPIRIGYVGCLTGRLASLGIDGRDGVILAVEKTNETGGIGGRKIELIVRDDRNDPRVAAQVDKELVGEGVAAIVGHMTSAMSLAALPVIDKSKTVMVSPTSSSDKFTAIDDNFIRISPSSRLIAKPYATYVREKLGMKRMAVVYDLSNRAHTESWYSHFKSEFESLGGRIVWSERFDSAANPAFTTLARALVSKNPDSILILAGALDTAMICQQVRKLGSAVPFFATQLSSTDEIIGYGGPAVEGITFFQNFNSHDQSRNYLVFRENHLKRFRREPTFASVYAYEAAQMIFTVLAMNRDPRMLKQTILRQGTFHGLQGDFVIDRFGDVDRRLFMMTIKNGRMVPKDL